eukprot:1192736-Prorocentrum_minimum.AAC.3
MCLTRQPIVRRAGGGIGHLEGAPPHPSGALQGVRVDATPRGWTLSKAEGGGRYAQGEPLQGVRGASEQRLMFVAMLGELVLGTRTHTEHTEHAA